MKDGAIRLSRRARSWRSSAPADRYPKDGPQAAAFVRLAAAGHDPDPANAMAQLGKAISGKRARQDSNL
jgi:hypothetical protein